MADDDARPVPAPEAAPVVLPGIPVAARIDQEGPVQSLPAVVNLVTRIRWCGS